MRIKLDENLPLHLAGTLAMLGHDVHTVYDEGLKGKPDAEVWTAAQKHERLLITQDLDFSDARRFTPGLHQGILLIRLGSPSRNHLAERVASLFRDESVDQWAGCFVVATDRKVRVLRPAAQPSK